MAERDVGIIRNISRIIGRTTDMPGAGYNNEDLTQNFEPSWTRILVIGAGGLGCELLKCLALSGFVNLDVIDMDTIDLSNLNRQFLFRESDIGKSKAEVASAFVRQRCPWMNITAHHGKIQDKDDDFYRQFQVIVLGLDSIHARQWMNETVARIVHLERQEDGSVKVSGIPLIDGGTEGFKGHSRFINMGKTACFQCTVDLFPPQVKIPMCTLENIPRQPEHCVMYVMQKTWDQEAPFGKGVPIDGDEPKHIVWLAAKGAERAAKFQIPGEFDFQFTQGVVKNIIPALASSNAIIASQCVNECLKVVTGMSPSMQNYYTMNGASDTQGAYGTLQDLLPNPDCYVCQVHAVRCVQSWTPDQLIENELNAFMAKQIKMSDSSATAEETQVSQLFVRVNPGAGAPVIELFLKMSGIMASRTEKYQGKSVYESVLAAVGEVVEGPEGFMNVVQLQVESKKGTRRVLLNFS